MPSSPPPSGTAQELFQAVQQHVEHNDLETAAHLLDQMPLESLDTASVLSVRALALQLAVDRAQYDDAMLHAAAAFDLDAEEPLLYHLLGRALWATGRTRSAADALVRAAELLQSIEDAGHATQLPLDKLAVYFMAGEVCQHYEQFEAALAFFERARRHTPNPEAITRAIADAIADVKTAMATTDPAP